MYDEIKVTLEKLYAMERSAQKPPLNEPELVVLEMLPFRKKRRECFVAFFLDNGNHIIKKKVMSKGTVDQTPVYPRDIIWEALKLEASAIIVAHNHPGGKEHPSMEDRTLTSVLKQAAELFRIRFLDHVIVGRFGHYSFKENNDII